MTTQERVKNKMQNDIVKEAPILNRHSMKWQTEECTMRLGMESTRTVTKDSANVSTTLRVYKYRKES